MTSELYERADALEKEAKELRDRAHVEYLEKLRATPMEERIIYAAYSRCPCGAGLAYDPAFEDENSVFNGPLSGYWDCSAILLGVADQSLKHTGKLPFAFYNVKSEQQPSAQGATTRPAKEQA